MVVVLPICPPASIPSMTTASAPAFSIRFAKATEATTGMTIIPAALNLSIYFPGFPAPVQTTFTPDWQTTSTTSSTKGLNSMIFTPKGLSVNCFISSINPCTTGPGA